MAEHNKESFLREYCKCRNIPVKITRTHAVSIDGAPLVTNLAALTYVDIIKCTDALCVFDDETGDYVSLSDAGIEAKNFKKKTKKKASPAEAPEKAEETEKFDSSNPRYLVYTDGGCAVNPCGPGGAACVVLDRKTQKRHEFSEGYKSTTNNRMEIRAFIIAMKFPYENNGAEGIKIISDSEYVIRTVLGQYQKKKNLDLWAELDKCMRYNATVEWVRGHSGVPENERCDELCTLAMQAPINVDEGFDASASAMPSRAQNGSERASGGAMAVSVSPAPFGAHMSSKRKVQQPCWNAVRELNNIEKPSFKNLASVKVGGTDGWSSLHFDEAEQEFDPCEIEYFRNYLSGSELLTALRWFGRGMKPEFAVRKVLVDKEIAANAR